MGIEMLYNGPSRRRDESRLYVNCFNLFLTSSMRAVGCMIRICPGRPMMNRAMGRRLYIVASNWYGKGLLVRGAVGVSVLLFVVIADG